MEFTKENVINYYKNKYKYMTDEDLEIMYDCAYDIMLNLRYPVHNNIEELPKEYLRKHRTWIFRAIQSHIDKEGMTNALSYRENGVTITFDKTGLPKDLVNEIVPMAKIGAISL